MQERFTGKTLNMAKTMDFIHGKYEMQGCCTYLLGTIARLTRLNVYKICT